MNSEKEAYVLRFGQMWEKLGVTFIGGKILGYLLVCDQPEVSFQTLVEELKVSKASVSNNLKMLEEVGFIEKVNLPKDRKSFYRPAQVDMANLMRERLQLMSLYTDLMDEGLRIKTQKKDGAAQFMRETGDFYRWFAVQLPKFLDNYQKIK
ncbi:MAG: MarR family transcriptional regulator [Cryomorphaceae bacterium]|nr:MarR family transcriptional regulator [Cryomorphaceae bacterium]